MRMINELVVKGAPPELARLIERIERSSPDGWRRELAIEDRLKSMRAAPLGALCFSWQGGEGKPPASLFLEKIEDGELSVSNIVPASRTPLTDEEYNAILSKFREDVIKPNSDDMNLNLFFIPPLARLEASLSPEAVRRLRVFSLEADRESLDNVAWRRWDQFLVQIHLDEPLLDEADLAFWLADQGWTAAQSGPLLDRYRMGQSLLSIYDEDRVSS